MKKNYITPTLRVMHIAAASMLAASETNEKVYFSNEESNDVGWSKSYNGFLTDDELMDE